MYDGLRVLVLGACNLNDTVYSLEKNTDHSRQAISEKFFARFTFTQKRQALVLQLHKLCEGCDSQQHSAVSANQILGTDRSTGLNPRQPAGRFRFPAKRSHRFIWYTRDVQRDRGGVSDRIRPGSPGCGTNYNSWSALTLCCRARLFQP